MGKNSRILHPLNNIDEKDDKMVKKESFFKNEESVKSFCRSHWMGELTLEPTLTVLMDLSAHEV